MSHGLSRGQSRDGWGFRQGRRWLRTGTGHPPVPGPVGQRERGIFPDPARRIQRNHAGSGSQRALGGCAPAHPPGSGGQRQRPGDLAGGNRRTPGKSGTGYPVPGTITPWPWKGRPGLLPCPIGTGKGITGRSSRSAEKTEAWWCGKSEAYKGKNKDFPRRLDKFEEERGLPHEKMALQQPLKNTPSYWSPGPTPGNPG